MSFKIVKKWKSDFYTMPNAFLNGYCKEVGWQGHIVYSAFWRHANGGKCFPSLEHLAIELGVSEFSVKKGIKSLKDWGIVASEMRTRTAKGRGSNIYYLLGKSEWKPITNWSNQNKKDKPFRNIPHKP